MGLPHSQQAHRNAELDQANRCGRHLCEPGSKARDKRVLRDQLLAEAMSGAGISVDHRYFESLRACARSTGLPKRQSSS